MPRIKGTNNRQSAFLRAFHLHPDGPPPSAWPSPAILRRWLDKPAFRRRYDALRAAIRSRVAFQSLCSALAAHNALHPVPEAPESAPPSDPSLNPEPLNAAPASQTAPDDSRTRLELQKLRHRASLTYLRLAHASFPTPPRRPPIPPKPPRDPDEDLTDEEYCLTHVHPNCRTHVAIAFRFGEEKVEPFFKRFPELRDTKAGEACDYLGLHHRRGHNIVQP